MAQHSASSFSQHIANIGLADLRDAAAVDSYIRQFEGHPVRAAVQNSAVAGCDGIVEHISQNLAWEFEDIASPGMTQVPSAGALRALAASLVKLDVLKLAEQIGAHAIQEAKNGNLFMPWTPLEFFPAFREVMAPRTYFTNSGESTYTWDPDWGNEIEEVPDDITNNDYITLLLRVSKGKNFTVEVALINHAWNKSSDEYAPIKVPEHPHEGKRYMPVCIRLAW
uniref:Uncharacterized protein n=1 Tax=Alexandrium catenella TaxID=2925 RepID=A0A7S1QIN8_ALECA|mmetsp:Transcript_32185/g.87235  ORF Transcript_32185/g.87235 Transcript_32185/m.87235 type:complete len:224 (+) Transcript_32185:139-810(+)|eukprot:CAMPEP_0171186258 /NCGR_PEP_ID=MMETSP0790-20130122/16719_1 /TAXON_ID=2925 /ORGANISM="Alexandrium catenella, Strain OF101" /LENGTH=223 /DNA_ID=CAMNT_0011651295 /DNA_START=83 /DNA_END=754 /DNA_ORIENTATION=+